MDKDKRIQELEEFIIGIRKDTGVSYSLGLGIKDKQERIEFLEEQIRGIRDETGEPFKLI